MSILVRPNSVSFMNFSLLPGNVYFSDGGYIDFHVTSKTIPIQVSGCVNFGGSVTIDVSRLPKNITNITLLTFNCSTGNFGLVEIDSESCSHRLDYQANALILELKFDDCQREGDSIPYLWVLWIFIGLVVAIVVVVVVSFIVKSSNTRMLKVWVSGKNNQTTMKTF